MVIKIIHTVDGDKLWDSNRKKLSGSAPKKTRAPKAKKTTPAKSSTQASDSPSLTASDSVTKAGKKYAASKGPKPIISKELRAEINRLVDVDEDEGIITHRHKDIRNLALSGHVVEQPEKTWLAAIASGNIEKRNFTILDEYTDYEEALKATLVEMQQILAEEDVLRYYVTCETERFGERTMVKGVQLKGLHRSVETAHPELHFSVSSGEQGNPDLAKVTFKDANTFSIRFINKNGIVDTSRDGEVSTLSEVQPFLGRHAAVAREKE